MKTQNKYSEEHTKIFYIKSFLKIIRILMFNAVDTSLSCLLFGLFYIFLCIHLGKDVSSFQAPFSLCSYIQTSPSSRHEDTKGLNLLCDMGFPLGSHKQRTQRP